MASARKCGGCTLCCKVLPVAEIGKADNERCQHKCVKGCKIYRTPAMPISCRFWDCRWINGDDTADLSRPDRSHYVIDTIPDIVQTITETGEQASISAVQVWVDPDYRNAHRDPALRRFLQRRAEEDGMVAIIRYSADERFVLVAPPLAGGEWLERHGTTVKSEKSPFERCLTGSI